MYKLRTVDVWDTLLRRDCHPECIKLATARYLLLLHVDNLHFPYRDLWSLYRARNDVEMQLAAKARESGGDDEYRITDVLGQWLKMVCIDSWAVDKADELAQFELQVEVARSFPDTGIKAVLDMYPAGKSVFLSDFYMDSKMLGRLLDAKNIRSHVSEGVVSCDVGVNKRSGRLFKHVHAAYGVTPDEHIHIGDNQWSDVDAARQLGVTAVHYLPTEPHKERIEREQLFASRNALFDHIRTRSLTDFSVLNKASGFSLAQYGVEASPLFSGFALWIAEQALTQKLDCIYFMTREGEFFSKVYASIFPRNKLVEIQLPATHLLHVSRFSTFSASLSDVTMHEMARAWNVFQCQSVSGLFAMLNLDITDFSSQLNEFGLLADDVIQNPSECPSLGLLFKDSAFVAAARLSVEKQREILVDYLKQSGIFSGMRVGIVDIGWRGTIQDNLALLMPDVHFQGLYLGLRRFVSSQSKNSKKYAYGPDENLGVGPYALFEVFSALEMICSSPNGSVTGYKRDGDRIVPLCTVSEGENVAWERFSAHFQEGVFFAAERWGSYLNAYVVTASECRDAALLVWDGLRSAPSVDLVDVFMQTPQQDVFGFGDVFSRNQVPSIATILLSPFDKRRRRDLIEFVRRVQWTVAIEKYRNLGWFHRSLLSTTFRVANWAKLFRMQAIARHR